MAQPEEAEVERFYEDLQDLLELTLKKDVLFIMGAQFGTSLFSMSSSNCCFLTCTKISQEVGKVVWYYHL